MKFKEVPPPSLGYVLIVYHAFLFYEDKVYRDFLFSKFYRKNNVVK